MITNMCNTNNFLLPQLATGTSSLYSQTGASLKKCLEAVVGASQPANVLKTLSRARLLYRSHVAIPKTSARTAKASASRDCKRAAVLEYCSPIPKQFVQTKTPKKVYIFSHYMCFVYGITSELWLLPLLMNMWVSLHHHFLVSEVLDCSCLI